jgi:tryptophanyl-tRNA synthetase
MECTVYTGELSRMIQYKDKGRGQPQTRASLYTYPCLMAADILLYGAARVPVGDDQDQHVELARDLATRFNRLYGEIFVVPEAQQGATSSRVRDLADPARKMSKSEPDDSSGVIRMLDGPDVIRRKVTRSVTDSDGDVRYDTSAKPGVSNLLDIFAAADGSDPAQIAGRFSSYRELKEAAAESVIELLRPVQDRYDDLVENPAAIDWALQTGRDRAIAASSTRLEVAYRAVGLIG